MSTNVLKQRIDKKCFLLFYFRKTAENELFSRFSRIFVTKNSDSAIQKDIESVKPSVEPKVDLKLLLGLREI